jgi:hypothetical protein
VCGNKKMSFQVFLCFLGILVCFQCTYGIELEVSEVIYDTTADKFRIPQHKIHQDPEHDEYLTVEKLFKPQNCGDEHTRRSKIGDELQVKYLGSIHSSSAAGKPGTVFDKSSSGPFVFRLGSGQVIRGWDEG